MPRTFRRATRVDLARRRCLRCGYDGPAVQDGSIEFLCPHCGQDLYARPPRSYLELEGIRRAEPERPHRVGFRRWVAWVARLFGRAGAAARWPND
ncbi:MAG: hypothetical protein KJZ65_01550 [Phycisphaerales bacterium]|nr:hypothetical protein [Phycisphaerales bacterium]